MLQREGFVVADMSASTPSPSPLQRSSWKAEAIRKGNLKISGPIPITEDVPLSDEEEKEYAENGALDRALQPQDAPLGEQHQHQRPPTPPRPMQSPPVVPEHPTALRSNPVTEQSQQEEEVQEHPPSRSPQNVRQMNSVQRESIVPQSSLASPTSFRPTPESSTKAAQKKRKSGLRNVIRKMFGKRSPEPAQHQEDETARRGHSYHHSDPGLLRSTPPREAKTPPHAGPRISDLPVKELQPLHPLGQHLPYPMNVNAPPASPPQEYLTFDRPEFGRRRATLPTVPSAVTHRHSLDDSRPKMATWDERLEEDEMSPSGIGIAVSSPIQPTSKHDRRRSRSADALHSLVKERASTERRRSAEIKYWRASYMSGSVYSRPQTAKTVETIRSVHMQEPTIREPETESFIEMSATLVQADDDPQTPALAVEEPKRGRDPDAGAPGSAFNFGDLKNALFGPPAEPAPEPPCQPREVSPPPPPPAKSQNRLSMEDRVMDLESKYTHLESLTHRMSSRNNRQTIILESAPRNLRSRNRSTSVSASRSHSRSAPSIHQEIPQQSSSDTLEPEPAPGSPTLAVLPHNATEHAKALQDVYEALNCERNARKALEQQVCTLQHDVSDLHALVNKLIVSTTATSPCYPTPSPDTLVTSSEGDHRISCSTPRAPTHDRNVFYGQNGNNDRQNWRNDSESVYSEDMVRKQSYDDVATPDVWATPKEEGFGGSGFFHTEDRVRVYA
ncbi:hypothetical protein DDE82_004230 [Stemphylium lycopersici]|nr:hypothetical protein DDE82_004230 [Stemphylium lycopersici]